MKSVLSYYVNELIWHQLCPNEHEDVDQYDSYQHHIRRTSYVVLLICNTIQDNAMWKLSCKFGEWKWNPCWVIVLTSSSGTNYVPNEQEDIDQYGSFTIPSEIIPC